MNEDLESEYYSSNEHVKRFKESIRAADGILIVSPEYNFNIPGVLKNAIDIATRPRGDNSLIGKAFGIMTSSPGVTGGIRSQVSIRQTMFAFGGRTTGYPEFSLGAVHTQFDGTGQLNADAAQNLKGYLTTFVNLITQDIKPVTTESSASNVSSKI